MKYSELIKLKDKELQKKLMEQREKLRTFRFKITGGKAKNVKEGRNTRREIERITTEMGARKRAEQSK